MSRATVRITEQDFLKFINTAYHKIYRDKGRCFLVTDFEDINRRPFYIEAIYKPELGRVYFRSTILMDGMSRRSNEPLNTVHKLANERGIKVETEDRGGRIYFTLMCRFKNQQINYLAKMEQLLMECDYFNFNNRYIQSHSDI